MKSYQNYYKRHYRWDWKLMKPVHIGVSFKAPKGDFHKWKHPGEH